MAKKLVQTTGTILDKLEGRTLTNIVLDRKYLEGYDEETLPQELRNTRIFPKDACLKEIKKDMAFQIVNQFIQHLTQKELIRWTKHVIPKKVLSTKDVNNPTSMNVMKKRLKEYIEDAGLRGYVKQRKPSCELLWKTLKSLNPWLFNKENPASSELPLNDGSALLKLIYQQLNILALEYILFELSIKTLQQMVEDSELNIKTQSKPMLVRNLVEMKDYKPRPVNFPPRVKAPVDEDDKKAKAKKNKDKENQNPEEKITARTKLSNLLVIFTDDEDDKPWNDATFKKMEKQEIDLSIDSENDADKHPPPLYKSSLSESYSDSDSEFDAKKQRRLERELRREERKKKKEMKKARSKSKKSRKYESFTESSSGDSNDKKHSKKKKSKKTKREDKDEKDKDNKDKDNEKDGDKTQKEEPKDTEKDQVEVDEENSKKSKKVTAPETDQGRKNKQKGQNDQEGEPETTRNPKPNKKERSENDENSAQPSKKKSRHSNNSKEESEEENNPKNTKPTNNSTIPSKKSAPKIPDPPPEDSEGEESTKTSSKKPNTETDTKKNKTDPKPPNRKPHKNNKEESEEDKGEEPSSPVNSKKQKDQNPKKKNK